MPIITAANLGLEILSGMERSIAAGHLGPTNTSTREPREVIKQTLNRMHGRTDDAAIRERIKAVLVAMDDADRAGLKGKARKRPAAGNGWRLRAGLRETIVTALEARIADGSVRGPRHRRLRRQFIGQIGGWLEGESDPDRRIRLGAILRGLEEADKLPMPKVNPDVFSSAGAAQLFRTREV